MPRGWAESSNEARLAALAFLDAQRPLPIQTGPRPGPAAQAAAAGAGPRYRGAGHSSTRPALASRADPRVSDEVVQDDDVPDGLRDAEPERAVGDDVAKPTDEGCAGAAFSRIYREEDWSGQLGSEALSGLGSREDTTREFRAFLESFLRDRHISSVVDAGCGHWPSGYQQYMKWQNVRYVGLDVVPYVVEENRAYFARDAGAAAKVHELQSSDFMVGDVCGAMPTADLLIVKDVLMHLPSASVKSFLEHSANANSPRYKFVLLIQNAMPMNLREMMDIEAGQLLPFDITQPPFGASSFRTVLEWQSDEPKTVQLWTRA